ncbi:hypothetical protein ZWY2020_054570 [Hordeum vulgare]|nr:hypothetical protein ZWY2020_054570 [Hordeum vulgare]
MENESANKRMLVEQEPQATPASLDFMSSLPDDVLIVIISLLPINYGSRTTVLSLWWRPLWHSTHLDFINTHKLYHGYRINLDALFQILGSHHGPIRGLSTGKFRSNDMNQSKLDEWFQSPALDQLEKLSFHDGHMRSLPISPLRLTLTLRLTKFMNCHPPLNDALFFYND